jgi:hypothetical protein
VAKPESKLIANVAESRQIDNFQPIVVTLRKKISGSIEGDAIQNDITGANGTPPIRSDAITGITPHEQKGLIAPTAVAIIIEVRGFLLNALLMCFVAPINFKPTAKGMVMAR